MESEKNLSYSDVTRSLLLSRWEKHLSKTILFKVKYKMRRLSYYLVLRNRGQGSINIFS